MKLISKVLVCLLILPAMISAQELQAGKPISPTDRGNTDAQAVEKAFTDDFKEMLAYYKGDGSGEDCFRIEEVAKCKLAESLFVTIAGYDLYLCRDLNMFFGYDEEVPMNEYYVPFQKVETSQTPYDTAYLTKEQVAGFVGSTESSLYDNLESGVSAEFDRLKEVASNHELGIDAESVSAAKDQLNAMLPDIKENLKQIGLDKRIRNSFDGSGRYMEMHVLPTGFDTEENNREERFDDVWVHQGAINSWIPKVNPVPIWFSEFPEHVLVTRFSELARKYDSLNQMMKAKGSMDNCVQQKFDYGTPRKIFEGKLQPLVGDSEKCLPWFYGPMFSVPFNYDKDTVYATQAATKRDWMGIQLAIILGKEIGAYNPDGGPADYHPLQDVKDGDHKRDIMQWIDVRRQIVKKGCQSEGEFYLPPIKGVDYKQANTNTAGERFVSAHYRYVRGCPVCYLPYNTNLDQILY